MEKNPERSDWSKIDAMTRKDSVQDAELVISPSAAAPMATAQTIHGVIAKFKANSLERRAALEEIQLATRARLDVFGHQLQEAAKTKKAEATMIAKQFLAQIDADYQHVLHEIGVRNEGARRETLKKIGDETSRDLDEIQNKNWPDFMIKATIELIMKRYTKFLARLDEDLEDYQQSAKA
jgi:hypothetical protein